MAFKMKNPSLAKLAKNVSKGSATMFNAKLKKASAEGKLSGKFKEAVDNSPMPKKGERGMLKSKDRKGNVEYHQGYTFKEAFADARKEGVKTFTHGGKKYNTKLAKSGKTEGISALDKLNKLPRTEGMKGPLDKLAKIAGKAASKTAGKNVGKALTKAAKKSKTKKTSQEDFKPAFEGGDYSKADLAKMTPKQRKKIEEGQE
tara:strand:- start:162 stop:767 length:606 start_codon:yes stop_codon:yes gene_type:complete